ncbi:MAG: GNAT family N-acetyltransferase [Allosphingosinicella sp.]
MIQTDRLILRRWTEADIEPFLRHTNTAAVMKWLGGVKPPEEAREIVCSRIMRWQEERSFTFWVVERKSDGALLGFCGLKLADGENCPFHGEYEIGWRFREDSWGQGYAREAALASLEFAFERLAAPRVVAITFRGNEASWGLMERLGMKHRPELGYDDSRFPELNPTIVYEIKREDWQR